MTTTAFVLIVGLARAQPNDPLPVATNMFGFNWEISIPFNDFVSATSIAGFGMEYRKLIKDNFSLGFDISWNSYAQYAPRQTYPITDGAVTTDFYKYLYTLPLALNAHYYFYRGRMIVLYAAIGLGAVYSEQKLYYNAFVSDDYNWGFLVRPEAGALIRPSTTKNFAFLAGVRYSDASNHQKSLPIIGLRALGFRIGVVGFY
jgi:opacity protein-like surface antigen